MVTRILISGRAASKKTTIASLLVNEGVVSRLFDADWVIESMRPTWKIRTDGRQLSISPEQLAIEVSHYLRLLSKRDVSSVVTFNAVNPFGWILAMQEYKPTIVVHLCYKAEEYTRRWQYDPKTDKSYPDRLATKVGIVLGGRLDAAIHDTLTKFILAYCSRTSYTLDGKKVSMVVIDVTKSLRMNQLLSVAETIKDIILDNKKWNKQLKGGKIDNQSDV